LRRTVTFQGMIVRPLAGDTKAVGYFVLPQLPATGQSSATAPILSGRMFIEQAPAPQ